MMSITHLWGSLMCNMCDVAVRGYDLLAGPMSL